MGGCKKLFKNDRIHLEAAKGSHAQASDYIKANADKPNPIFWEMGKYMEKQEVVWTEIRDYIKSGNMEALAEEYPREWCMYGDKWKDRVEFSHPKWVEIDNLWIMGPSGCGKTKWVIDNHPVYFDFNYRQDWWGGYKGESVVLMDDFDPYFKPSAMAKWKRYWDHYEFPAQIKGMNDKKTARSACKALSCRTCPACSSRSIND